MLEVSGDAAPVISVNEMLFVVRGKVRDSCAFWQVFAFLFFFLFFLSFFFFLFFEGGMTCFRALEELIYGTNRT